MSCTLVVGEFSILDADVQLFFWVSASFQGEVSTRSEDTPTAAREYTNGQQLGTSICTFINDLHDLEFADVLVFFHPTVFC